MNNCRKQFVVLMGEDRQPKMTMTVPSSKKKSPAGVIDVDFLGIKNEIICLKALNFLQKSMEEGWILTEETEWLLQEIVDYGVEQKIVSFCFSTDN